jgi:hypothetical protein
VQLVPVADARALAAAIVEQLRAHGRSDASARRARPVLTAIEPPPFAALLRAAARTGRSAA